MLTKPFSKGCTNMLSKMLCADQDEDQQQQTLRIVSSALTNLIRIGKIQ